MNWRGTGACLLLGFSMVIIAHAIADDYSWWPRALVLFIAGFCNAVAVDLIRGEL